MQPFDIRNATKKANLGIKAKKGLKRGLFLLSELGQCKCMVELKMLVKKVA